MSSLTGSVVVRPAIPLRQAARHRARFAFGVLTWVVAGGIVLQVFAAGLGVFVGDFTLHRIIPIVLAVLLLVELGMLRVVRPPRTIVRDTIVLAVAFVVQGLLIHLVTIAPVVTALHPVNAMLLFVLSFSIAGRSRGLLDQE